MAIKIGGTSIIDDNKNIANVGIVTIGTGGTTGIVQVGTGSTIFGSGNVAIAGTLYALDISVPLKIDAFEPAHLETNISASSNIKVYFNKIVGIGSTGFVELKTNSGALIQRFNVGAPSTQISFENGSRTLVINPSGDLPKSPGAGATIFTVVSRTFLNDPAFTGINTTTSVGIGTTYKFRTEPVTLGSSYEGGYLICVAGGNSWIVAPSTTELSRNFSARANANTCAQTVTGCSGWFIPTQSQLQNPGYTCRSFWDSYKLTRYWSSTFVPGPLYRASGLDMSTGGTFSGIPGYSSPNTGSVYCVRSFRCVTY